MTPTTQSYMLLAEALFCLGLYAALSRKNVVSVLIGVELMVSGVNLNLITFSALHGSSTGRIFALFSIALTVAEVVVALAIVILLFRRHRNITSELASESQG